METSKTPLAHRFKNTEYYELALTHRSCPQKSSSSALAEHNERLEFIGDSVLNCAVALHLFHLFPNSNEGVLSQMRSSLVNESHLCQIAKDLKLGESLKISFQEEKNGGRENSRVLASAFEAIIGALFLDLGFKSTQDFILEVYEAHWPKFDKRWNWDKDYKTQLQELSQKTNKKLPTYSLIKETGPSHKKNFEMQVQALGLSFKAEAHSKKQAEIYAAKKALDHFKKQGDIL